MRNLALCFLLGTLLAISACNSGPKAIVVSVSSPTGAQALDIGQSFSITASIANDTLNKGITWTLTGVGALSNQSATGATYTAPANGTGGTATVTATSVADPSKSSSVTIVVTAMPSITTTSLASAVIGTAYSGPITVTGGAGALAYSLSAGSLPPGLSLNASTGAITGTPTGPTGTVNFTVQVKDGSTVSPQSTTKALSILVNQPPAITSLSNASFTAGVAGSFTVTTTGTAPITITETGALPTGVTFKDNGDGTATLSGSAATPGAYPITFTASNGFGTNATQNFTLNIQQAAAITSANASTFTVGTAGTFTVAASGFPAPTLTETGALPSGVTFTSATGVLAGTPAAGTGGTYPLTFKAHNGVGADATQTFTLTVNQGPAITSLASATFTLGAAGSFSVTTSGLPTPTLSETGALPGNVTFTDNGNGTATLAGTPTGTAGNYPLTIKAHNGVGTDATQSFTLTVGQAPSFTSANASTFTVGTAGTFTVTASGFPVPTLTETGALPTGVTFTAATGTLAGTPAAGTGGTYTLTFTAHNGTVPDATQTFTLTVNQAPAITSAASTAFWLGNFTSFAVTTTGLPAPALTETGALPNGVTFVDNHNGTATLAGVPAAGTYGNYPLTLKATNSVNTATQSFTLSVVAPATITSANNATFTVGTLGTFSVTTNGSPSPSLTETGALPSGVSFVDNGNGTATLSGTPAAGTGGPHSLTFTAHNGISTDYIQTFTLNVNEAPTITSANHATFTLGAAGTFNVTTTGTPVPSLTETGALPGNVTFTDNGNGTATLAGTPSTSGTFTLTLKATNVVSSANQTFTLTVNTAPVITSANNATFTVGSLGSFTVTTTGTPAPSITETGSLPNGVTFTDNLNGTATLGGTPASGTGGRYNLTFTAHNGAGTDATQTFTLTVNQAPLIFSTNNTTFTLGTLGTFTVTTTGYPAPVLTYSGALPSGVSFTDVGNGTATLAGTPTAGGTFTLTLTANNGVGTAATQTFTLTVSVPALILPAPNSSTPGSATLNQPYTGFINASGGAPGYTWTVNGTVLNTNGTPVPLQDGLSVSNTGGNTLTISGTPTAAQQVSFTVSVKDSANTSVGPFTYTVTVNNPTPLSLPTPNSNTPGPATTNQAYSGAINASGGVGPFTFTINGTAVATNGTPFGLQDGLSVTNTGGNTLSIGGTPTTAQTVSFTVSVKDSTNASVGPFTYSIVVSPPTPLSLPAPSSNTPGPATTNQSYAGFINASGGVPNYAWTVNGTPVPTDGSTITITSGDGLTALNTGGNTLSIIGTPTTAQAVTLNISVKDSTNTTVSQTYTILVSNPTPLSLPTPSQANLGSALVNYPYTEGFSASGGIGPYTWTVNSNILPSNGSPVLISDGISVSNGGGNSLSISGTPTTGPQTINLVVSVTDSASGSAGPVTYPITVSNGPNGLHNSYLSGTYSCLLEGFSDGDGSRWASLISIVANGSGTFSSGVFDTNGRGFTAAMTGTLTGTYSIDSVSNQGIITVIATPTSGTPHTSKFAVALTTLGGPPALQGRMVEIDDVGSTPSGQHGSGNCYRDTTSAFASTTLSNSSFAFVERGENSTGSPRTSAGRFTALNGNLSAGDTDEIKSSGVQNLTFTGNYTTPNATTGRLTANFISSQGTLGFALYIIDANRMFLLNTDTSNGLHAGDVRKQLQTPYSVASINGPFVLHSQGSETDTNGNVTGYWAQIFQGSGDGTGKMNINKSFEDEASTGANTGNYSVDTSAGQVTVTFDGAAPGRATIPTGPTSFAYLYMYGTNSSFEVSDGVEWGQTEPQTISTFTDAAIAGNYVIGQVPILEPDNGSGVGVITLDSSGNITGSSTNGGPGNFSWESPIAVTYTWSSTTFGTFLPDASGKGLSCVAVSTTESVCIENTTSNPDIMIFQQ